MISACEATCETHPHVTIVHFCPACRGSEGGKLGGAKVTERKRESNRRNAMKPRPRTSRATEAKPTPSPDQIARAYLASKPKPSRKGK